MSHSPEPLDSTASYHLVKQMVDQLSWSQRERLKREIDLTPLREAGQSAAGTLHNRLTSREREVLALIADGYTRREVGEALKISHNTASCHVSHIYEKLQISTIAEATRVAIQLGLVHKPIVLSSNTEPAQT